MKMAMGAYGANGGKLKAGGVLPGRVVTPRGARVGFVQMERCGSDKQSPPRKA
jgi:hypothetical protein